jgi:hypothetical protein
MVIWTRPIPWGQIIDAGSNLKLQTDHEDATSAWLRCFAQGCLW